MTSKKAKTVRYWNSANIAKLWWCHQFAIFKQRQEQPTIRAQIEHLRKLPEWLEYIPKRRSLAVRCDTDDRFESALEDQEEFGKNLFSARPIEPARVRY
jgi:hypothetical protein